MIASPTRNSDLEHYLVCLEIMEITIRAYQRGLDVGESIKSQKEYLDKLKAKLADHDYTAEDKAYLELDKLIKELSPYIK